MILETITLVNFLSIGNVTQTVKLNKDALTLVLGVNRDIMDGGSRNGVGKSTLTQAIFYALFGEPLTRIKLDNLVNKDNGKGMIVSLSFTQGNNKYRIERGRKPNILALYINDEELKADENDARGENKDTQHEINKIIKISPDLFKQTVILNTKITPFLAMRDKEQRTIIEELLGIDILSKKAEKLKDSLKEIKEDIKAEEIRIQSVKQINDKITNQINELKYKSKQWDFKKNKQMSEMIEVIEELKLVNIDDEIVKHKLLKEFNDLKQKKNIINGDSILIEKEISQIEKNLVRLNKNKEQIEKNVCPTCSQKIHDDHAFIEDDIVKEISDSNKRIKLLNNELRIVQEKINDIDLSLKIVGSKPETTYDDVEDAYEHKNTIQLAEKELEDLNKKENPFFEQIENLNISGIQAIDMSYLEDLNLVKEHQDFLYKMLTNKESPIRKKIIDQNLSMLNNNLENYIDTMKLPHRVKFNNDLSVTINNLGNEFDFDQLSNGEQNRVILSLAWAFREVYEYLNHPINVSIIDELIDSGMDSLGTDSSLGILKTMVREKKKSVFLISHKDGLESRVDNVLDVIKEDGFTTYIDNEDEF